MSFFMTRKLFSLMWSKVHFSVWK